VLTNWGWLESRPRTTQLLAIELDLAPLGLQLGTHHRRLSPARLGLIAGNGAACVGGGTLQRLHPLLHELDDGARERERAHVGGGELRQQRLGLRAQHLA
jgi:hypothetical protein